MTDTTLPSTAPNDTVQHEAAGRRRWFSMHRLSTDRSRPAVALTVKAWFVLAALGHWMFLAYILAVFVLPIAQHGPASLEGTHLPTGFREGDFIGNLAASAHVVLAAIIIGGGPLQLIPAVRARWPGFHRWLGRSYLAAAVSSSVAGLYMVWTRGTVGGLPGYIGISLDGVLIIGFAAAALVHAVSRRLREHRRWALRLFMAASAVWFYRVGFMGWMLLTGGVGIDFETFTGPFPYTMSFAQYLVPLAMLEWYFRCQGSTSGPRSRWLFTGTLVGLTAYMGLGIVAATMGMWLPRM